MAKAVIFDMDGVLVDSMHAHWLAWQEAFATYSIDIKREDFDKTPGMTVEPVIKLLGGDNFTREQIEDLTVKQELAFQKIIAQNFPAIPGVSELIKSLDEDGWKMAVGTSGPKANLELILGNIPESERIQAHVVHGEYTHGKPDPEVFLTAAQRLGVTPGEAVVVEDSLVGLEAAKRGGFLSVALTTTHPEEQLEPLADLVVDSLTKVTPKVLDLLFT
jgi:haloacid dehalogenase superfamily, subfamily IA, variant 3 with third motif having DD or ED